MIIHDLVQGSGPWQDFRLQHKGASEAAAMLGLSPKMKRSELLRMKHTGLAREFSDWLQAHVLDKGHEVEALARPHIEALIGEELYPVTCSDGDLSASCDGLTLGGEIAAEHKQWSEPLAEQMRAGQMPLEHMPQCQQVLMVTGAERLIFVVSDGTPERMLHLWVQPDPAWFQRLSDGWAQFDKDLAAYQLPEPAAPAPSGKAPDTLPALRIEVTGAVTASNLAEFRETALAAIRSVNRTLTTDQDFADADKAVKWCAEVEQRLAAAKEHALSQTASIDALFKTIDDISAEARRVRLDLDKLVTRRKVEVKEEAVTRARAALDQHIAALNAEIAPMRLLPVAADFAGAIKSKRSLESMQDALDTTLAGAKIAADAQARAIRANVERFKAMAEGCEFLFSDLSQLVHRAPEDFGPLVAARVVQHRAAEAAKIEAAEKRAREQEAARIAAQQAADAAAATARQVTAEQHPQQVLKAEPATADATDRGTAANVSPRGGATGAGQAAAAAPAVAGVHEPASLNLGAISARLGFALRADFLADVLHIEPAAMERGLPRFRESDFPRICAALIEHVETVQMLQAA